MSDHVVVQPFYSNPTGALEVRAATATLPDPEELANAEGRAERYEAETMRLQTTVAEVLETLRLEQDERDHLRRQVGELQRSSTAWLMASRGALPLRMKRAHRDRTDGLVPPPAYHSEGAAGLDLCADFGPWVRGTGGPSNWEIDEGETMVIPCGWCFEIPPGFQGRVLSRSGTAKRGIVVVPGTIDSDYRGEVAMLVEARDHITIRHGERIAQLVVQPVARCEVQVVEELGETVRGAAGFGSTGR
jgi:dUTP pyrophosphatase